VIKLFRAGPALVLSDVVPSLEHLGVSVIDERPYRIDLGNGAERWIDVFGVRAEVSAPGVRSLDDLDARARVADVFLDVWAGRAEDDLFNRLVLHAGLTARDVVILRALAKYLRQAGVRFTETYIADTLNGNPRAARLLVDLFRARFEPSRAAGAGVPDEIVAELADVIDAVVALDEDRMLRALLALVNAAVRTNAFQVGASGAPRPWIAIKLDPLALDFLPRPRPHHEIWVYSPTVEGVHLRAGDIARGGIRWSDRREDFRTEILGLMKAQTVKNSVIVPVGAKGGFVVKAGEAVECYRKFIRGLLDVTDNLVDGRVVPPPGVVRFDADDPYLVVAADKGTATFSDIANALAAEYAYWLDDAFASGGSSGYDHKAMGITARGAWVSVRAHFRAKGIDADTADLTVVGIGDMSGDVFGNGLLRSRHLKLVAAFDHRHVFLDPSPDPEASYAERQRLFDLPRSSWTDYDPAVLSPGGVVVPRSAKAVSLSPEARAVLAVDTETVTPDDVVRAILRAPVDLLWNGGVGTFVKATTESNADVGDRTNDDVRVDASELRCTVVAEGGNLGFTQKARVEYALAGGRINTDAIDNSAGVDTSDHEVNIKILLRTAIADGSIVATERAALLHSMADEVASLVLADNEAQANALEIAEVEAASLVGVHARQIERLEQAGHLDRALEGLPSTKELQERHALGLGLTAPELAVLLAYTKLDLERELLDSDVPDDPYLRAVLVDYFPSALRARGDAAMSQHRLRREIVATGVANSVVNRAGISFLSRLNDETGAPLAHLTRAHLIARDVFATNAVWQQIDELDFVVPAAVQNSMFLTTRRLVERAARRLVLRDVPLPLGTVIDRYRPGVQELVAAMPALLTGGCAAFFAEQEGALVAASVPDSLARVIASYEWLPVALDLVDVADGRHERVAAVGGVHYALSDTLRLDWLRDRIGALPRADRWQTEARAALRDELHDAHRTLTAEVLESTDAARSGAARVQEWIAAHELAVERYLRVLRDVEAEGVYDLATLAVARRALRELGADHG
jgi:glutamate dehydrogenase